MTDARYYSITLQPDAYAPQGTYTLKFSTSPGMSTSVGELRMGDLDALASILNDRASAADGPLIVAPRPRQHGEPCPHCNGVGSGCQCDIEYA